LTPQISQLPVPEAARSEALVYGH